MSQRAGRGQPNRRGQHPAARFAYAPRLESRQIAAGSAHGEQQQFSHSRTRRLAEHMGYERPAAHIREHCGHGGRFDQNDSLLNRLRLRHETAASTRPHR